LSDSALSQRQAGKRVPKRHDWLPNRMFDPANNPFAIQNLLAREREKEDAAFHVDLDGRPDAAYAGNALLRDQQSLPPKDFRSNQLLGEHAIPRAEFLAEYDTGGDEDAVSVDDAPAAADQSHGDVPEHAERSAAKSDLPAVAAPEALDSSPQPQALPDEGALSSEESTAADAASETAVAGDSTQDDVTNGHGNRNVNVDVDGHEQGSDVSADMAAQSEAGITAGTDPESSSEQAIGAMPAESAPGNLDITDVGSRDAILPSDQTDTPDPVPEQPEQPEQPESPESPESLAGSSKPSAAEFPADASTGLSPQDDADAGTHEPLLAEPGAGPFAEMIAEPAEEPSKEPTAEAAAEPAEPPATEPALNSAAIESLLQAAREEAREQGRQEAREAAYQEGLDAGIAQATAQLHQEFDEQRVQLTQLIAGLQRLSEDPDTLFEPMKKLAVHLAEQLVRGELTQSPQTISRLVDNCLRELAASGEKAVIVHLNPEDLEQYKPLIASFGDSIVLRPDALLARGSVRASLDGSVVEDLIDRRVKGISKSLAQPTAGGWRPAAPNPLLQRSSSQPARKAAAVGAQIPDPIVAADDTRHAFADDVLASEDTGPSGAEPSGDLHGLVLAGDPSPAEAGDSAAS